MNRPTAVELWETEFFKKHAGTALQKARETWSNDLLCEMERHVRFCESPLEAAFAAWWVALAAVEHWEAVIVHQLEITACSQQYRLDLVIIPDPEGLYKGMDTKRMPLVAVELDGHDFHERTKEQVTLRNQRDRDLVEDGWTVLHFSGSEFHRSPADVVRSAYRSADARFWKAHCELNGITSGPGAPLREEHLERS